MFWDTGLAAETINLFFRFVVKMEQYAALHAVHPLSLASVFFDRGCKCDMRRA
jgi:hypothetical protein